MILHFLKQHKTYNNTNRNNNNNSCDYYGIAYIQATLNNKK